MTTRPLLLEVDLLRGLATLLQRGPVALVTTSSSADLAALLVREARTFHTVEGDAARARLATAEAEAAALADAPDEARALDRAAAARAAIAVHAAAATVTLQDARVVVDRLVRVDRAERAPAGATVVSLADDGWSLIEDEAARRAARAAFLGH